MGHLLCRPLQTGAVLRGQAGRESRLLPRPPAHHPGCGPGRNALYLDSQGFAVGLSPAAVDWAEERARETGAHIRFQKGDAFALAGTALRRPYDLIYDLGCFHQLPPHRRISYLTLLNQLLAPGGHFALACFTDGENGGSDLPDAAFYRDARLHGGLAYTPQSLRRIFSNLTEVELRLMRDEPTESAYFGEPFLWTALFRRYA